MVTIKAKKSLGQNFLIDTLALEDIAHSIEVRGKHIIEVGPGYGALTDTIIMQDPETLDLVELDTDMIRLLENRILSTYQDSRTEISIHHQDVLQFVPSYETYSVIANIPYYITSPILFHFLYPSAGFVPPQEMTIMMQAEVGEKILAGRAKKTHHSLISLAMEEACEDIQIVRYVSREAFDPMPKVDSIVLRFSVRHGRDRLREDALISLWKRAFAHPRKTLMSNLKGTYPIEIIKTWMMKYGYDEKVRAEAIKREDWGGLLDI